MKCSAKRVAALFLAVALLFAVGYGVYRYIEINRLYPNPRVVEDAGGVLLIDGMEIRASDFTRMDRESLLKANPALAGDNALPAEDSAILAVRLSVKNTLEAENTFDLYNFYLENRNWSNGMGMALTHALGGQGTVTLKPDESCEDVLIYVAPRDSFFEKDWESFLEEEFRLTLLEHYPVLGVLKLGKVNS